MTECSSPEKLFQDDFFPNVKTRKIEVDFDGGNVSSDGGVLLLRQVDRRIRLLLRASKILDKFDARQKGKTEHGTYGMLAQRVFGIGCGYEDLNDHNGLRHDIAWQTAAGEDGELASAPTLCRFENRSTRAVCMELSSLLIDVFMEPFDNEPEEIFLDFDNTDDRIHGKQEGRFFHGYYDEYCFLPLYVFCGEKLVAALLQPSSEDGAKHAGGICTGASGTGWTTLSGWRGTKRSKAGLIRLSPRRRRNTRTPEPGSGNIQASFIAPEAGTDVKGKSSGRPNTTSTDGIRASC